jgi:hypothetical protein
VIFIADVYVTEGCMGIGAGNAGDTIVSRVTCKHNRWIRLFGVNAGSPANMLILYSYNGPAEWYLDNVSVFSIKLPIGSAIR